MEDARGKTSSTQPTLSRRRALAVLVGGAGAALIVACAPAAPPQVSTPATAPKRGGELRLGILRDGDINPHKPAGSVAAGGGDEESVLLLFGETLTELTPEGKIVAEGLAESWTISPDGLVYTFKLRQGVKFHNGREMTSADVKYLFDRIKDPAKGHSGRLTFTPLKTTTTPDRYTVVFTLSEPFAPFLAAVANRRCVIVPPELVDTPDFGRKFVGTGPYMYEAGVQDQYLKAVRFPDYWRPSTQYLDRITWTFQVDQGARTASLRAGQVDLLTDAPAAAMEVFAKDPSMSVFGGQGQSTYLWVNLNPEKVAAFKDQRVRQAISWAIDREKIASLALPGLAFPTYAGFLPADHWAGVKEPIYKRDLTKAKRLLSEAGYGSGLKFTLLLTADHPHMGLAAQTIQQQLREANVTMQLEVLDSSVRTQRQRALDFEANMHGTGGAPDPHDMFYGAFSKGNSGNYINWVDAQYEDLIAKARRTTNESERARLYQDAGKRLVDVSPWLFIYNYNKYVVANKAVRGYVWNPHWLDQRTLRSVWLDR